MWKRSQMIGALLLAITLSAVAQTPAAPVGSINFTPPAPGKLTVAAGVESCTLTGNSIPATDIATDCVLNGIVMPTFHVPVAALAGPNPGTGLTLGFNFGGDAITIQLTIANGLITYSAAATPSGGQTASGTGSF